MLGAVKLELWQMAAGAKPMALMQAIAPSATSQIAIAQPQIFVAIAAGLLMAFAFQLLLTNLGIAIGITALGLRLRRKSQPADTAAAQTTGSTVRSLSAIAGLSILVTINLVLLVACFLAAKLSLVSSPFVGAVLGVVIWSAYVLVLVWLSSTAMSSLLGSLFGTAAAGVRGIFSAIAAPFKSEPSSAPTFSPDAMRAEIEAKIRAEMQAQLETYLANLQPNAVGFDSAARAAESTAASAQAIAALEQKLASYLRHTKSKQLTPERVQQKLEALLNSAELETQPLPAFDRAAVEPVLRRRKKLDDAQIQAILSRVEQTWQTFGAEQRSPEPPPRAQLLEQLRQRLSALPLPELNADTLERYAERLIEVVPLAALQQWVSQQDFDAIAPLLQVSDELSDTVRRGVVAQVEGVRDRVMQPIEQVQQQMQQQMEALKQQAQQQAQQTRKAAAAAAWWVFGIAVTSLTSATIAGMVGVTGFAPAWSWLHALLALSG